ncbi:rRNA maturation RNase YbeY [Chlorobaculum sp. MV4-Y]|jgi:rRNA maturation RNase YbeY|uniref:rRNA maturation RNase YbeY n=1 Tax=Chlorobaculum sp. MV4-Y TaxID=2976335 RepID=UPI0021AF26C2|nr:rRNA maturation RNase YbeY [Chlorobaculum sp. MV4-Y]UWX58253.1 rRNA maturation RNase YbeY [Chlorobaculum sp. MV4-Y]
MPLQIFNTTKRTIDEALLAEVIQLVIGEEGGAVGSIEAIYCGNKMIRRINRDFLSHDYATDTITFGYNEGGEVEGEFYISLDVIESNARRFGVSVEDELLRVTIHSALHLMGYDDETSELRAAMSRREDHYLQRVRH